MTIRDSDLYPDYDLNYLKVLKPGENISTTPLSEVNISKQIDWMRGNTTNPYPYYYPQYAPCWNKKCACGRPVRDCEQYTNYQWPYYYGGISSNHNYITNTIPCNTQGYYNAQGKMPVQMRNHEVKDA